MRKDYILFVFLLLTGALFISGSFLLYNSQKAKQKQKEESLFLEQMKIIDSKKDEVRKKDNESLEEYELKEIVKSPEKEKIAEYYDKTSTASLSGDPLIKTEESPTTSTAKNTGIVKELPPEDSLRLLLESRKKERLGNK